MNTEKRALFLRQREALLVKINPAFADFPQEAALVGRLLLAFGEVEFALCRNADNAVDGGTATLRELYRQPSSAARFDMADAALRPVLTSRGLAAEHDIAVAAAAYCRRVRDQYAHCNWRDHPDAGIFFTNLTEAAARDGIFTFVWRHIDPSLLERQAAYFAHTLEWLTYLDVELAVRADKMSISSWPRPVEEDPPPLCNPLAAHVPPWLSKREQERHMARVD